MCGIVGGWWKNDTQIHSVLPNALRKIMHRGPDDDGYDVYPTFNAFVSFGHTRLSILDLSVNGHQPMHSLDGRFAIVFNGEIYNYRELRDELKKYGYVFRSDTDTEVLLTAWSHWEDDCLQRLVGMFSFAILDKINNVIICVRDAFGIKPFYYTMHEGFKFSSEIPSILELINTKPKVNWQRSYDYLVHGDYDSNSETFFDGISNLSPGYLLKVDAITGTIISSTQWWSPNIVEVYDWNFNDAVENVRELFLHNIRLHLRSDVPLGAALSGGIDSSAVVCAMRHIEPFRDIHTFSYIAPGAKFNEECWVDVVNNHVNGIPHKVSATGHELERDLDEMIRAQGEPFGSTSIYAQFRVFKLARESGITVVLDGQGADEMLAGYNGYPGQRLHSLIETGSPIKALKFLRNWACADGRSYTYEFKALAEHLAPDYCYDIFRRFVGKETLPRWVDAKSLTEHHVTTRHPRFRPLNTIKGRRVMAELAMALSERGLASLLRHGDRNSMNFGVESRVPFLTLDMVNLLLSMPESFLISPAGQTKHVFREAMKGIVPDSILNRKDKIGFAAPEKEWLFSIAEHQRTLLGGMEGVPLLNRTQLLNSFDDVISGRKPFTWQVWRWINFVRWHQLFFDN